MLICTKCFYHHINVFFRNHKVVKKLSHTKLWLKYSRNKAFKLTTTTSKILNTLYYRNKLNISRICIHLTFIVNLKYNKLHQIVRTA